MTSGQDKLVVLAIVPTELEATLIAAALQDRGIDAATSGAITSGFRAEAPGGVRILVQQADVARAKQAMLAYRQDLSDIDWSKVDIGEEVPEQFHRRPTSAKDCPPTRPFYCYLALLLSFLFFVGGVCAAIGLAFNLSQWRTAFSGSLITLPIIGIGGGIAGIRKAVHYLSIHRARRAARREVT